MINANPKRTITYSRIISTIATVVCLLLTPTLTFSQTQTEPSFCSHLPLVVAKLAKPFPDVHGPGTNEEIKSKVDAELWIFDKNPTDLADGPKNCLTDEHATVSVTMHYRGSSSLRLQKKQIGVKLKETWNIEKNPALKTTNFMGMPFGGKSWIFSGEQTNLDGTHLRNTLSFYLQNQLGAEMPANKAWAPRTRFFELFIVNPNESLDTKKDYAGLYILAESIQFAKERIHTDIKLPTLLYKVDQTPGECDTSIYDDLTQSHFFVYDQKGIKLETDTTPLCPNKQKTPDFWPQAFSLWTKSLDSNRQTAGSVHDSILINGKHKSVILKTDEDSFAVAFILNELIKDPDGYNKNTFFYQTLDNDKPESILTMYAGPLWDKNLGYDLNLANFPETGKYIGYGAPYEKQDQWSFRKQEGSTSKYQFIKYKFWQDALENNHIQHKICQYWFLSRQPNKNILTEIGISNFLDKQTNWINKKPTEQSDVNNTPVNRDCIRYAAEITAGGDEQCIKHYDAKVNLLKEYIKGRLEWMSSQLGENQSDCEKKLKELMSNQ